MQSGGVGSKPRRWLVLAPAVVSLAIGLRLGQPSVFPDEIGAILNARRVAGLGGPSPWWYLPGYGVLLVPIVAFTEDPAVLIRGIQAVNGALMVVACLGLVASLRVFAPGVSEGRRVQAAALAMLTPAYVYFAGFAIADNAMVAMSAWIAPATMWLRQAARSPALLVGFLGSMAAASVHSRAGLLPVAVAVGLILGQPTFDRAARAGAIVLGTIIGRLLAASVLDADGGSVLAGTGRQSFRALISDNLDPSAVVTLPATLLGQLFSVTVGSMGLVVLGLMYSRSLGLLRGPERAAAVAVAAALIASVGSSVLFTNGGAGDYALYARYIEVALPVVLSLGWLGLLERAVRPPLMLAAIMVAAGFVLVVLRGTETFDGRIQRLNVAGLAPFIRLGDGLQPVWLGLLGGIALVIVAVVVPFRSWLAVVCILGVFAVAVFDNVNASRSFVQVAGGSPALADTLDSLADGGCVALDQTGLEDFWFQENLRLHRLDADLRFWAVGTVAPPCDGLVLSSRADVGAQLPGWVPIAVEPSQVQWLWASPELQRDHSLKPLVAASLGAPLVEPSGTIELVVVSASDQEMVVQLTILNTGVDAFVPASNLPGGMGGVQIGLEWRSLSRPLDRTMEPIRVALGGLLAPGERATVTATVARPAAANEQLLHAELVQEGVGWIESVAVSTLVEANR